VLPDARVAFIDFGIVGRISPLTWEAMSQFLKSESIRDYRLMAASLAQMGATSDTVDIDAFAVELEKLFEESRQMLNTLNSQVRVNPDGSLDMDSVAMDVDDRWILDLVRVGETHGVKLPREFGLLIKQILYFDRYTQLLAPGLDVMNDDRVRTDTTYIDV